MIKSALIKIENFGDESERSFLEEKLEIGVENTITILFGSCAHIQLEIQKIRMIRKEAFLRKSKKSFEKRDWS